MRIFSGDESDDLWKEINSLDALSTGDDVRWVLYSIGCQLQKLENQMWEARKMNQREKIEKAVKSLCGDCGSDPVVKHITDTMMKAIEEPEQTTDWLRVDENTPPGTLCRFWDSDYNAARHGGLTKIDIDFSSPYWSKTTYWKHAELFLGIHLIPNPGMDKPPVDGEVVYISRNGSLYNGTAADLRWEHTDLGGDIVAWAPYDRATRQVDVARLRK
jgi:hypothetical protein